MIAATENAIIEHLRDAGADGRLGYVYRTLETYPDDFDAYLKDKGQLRTPAAWAVFLSIGSGVDHGDDDAGWNGEARFALVVAAQNLRNETATRHGGPDADAEPGSYQLAIDAVRLLSRSDLGIDLVEPITITGMRLVARGDEIRRQKLSLMAIELRCRLGIGLLNGADDLDAFATFHADWDVPAIGNVSVPLPADNADAADLVELPQ